MDAGDRVLFFAALALTARRDDRARDPQARGRAHRRILGMPTTRGDRLFISLIAAAIIHLVWIGVAGAETLATLPIAGGFEISSLWLASGISLVVAAAVFRTV